MNLSKYKLFQHKSYYTVFAFTFLYIIAFGIYFVTSGNTEFLAYLPVLVVLVIFVALTLPITKLPAWAVWLLSILELMHVAGGGVKVHGDVLYNLVLIPVINNGPDGLTFWRYDQLVHPYGSAVCALIIYFFLAPTTTLKKRWMIVIIALAAMGVGAINEIIEFIATQTIPHTDVGGYINTCLDLISNFVGGIAGAWIAVLIWKKKPPVEKPHSK